MGRNNHIHLQTTGSGGINQQLELATSDQLEDALNLWAPNGRLEVRPGYTSYGASPAASGTAAHVLSDFEVYKEEWSGSAYGAITDTTSAGKWVLSSLGESDRLYFGFSAADDSDSNAFPTAGCTDFNFVDTITAGEQNSNGVHVRAEYYDGSEWKSAHVDYVTGAFVFPYARPVFGTTTGMTIWFNAPLDWAKTTIDSKSRFWLRLSLIDAGDDALDSDVQLDATPSSVTYGRSGDSYREVFFSPVQYSNTKEYISLQDRTATLRAATIESFPTFFSWTLNTYTDHTPNSVPGTMAVVPQFDETFVAYGNKVFRFSPTVSMEEASVETDINFIGDKAAYDDEYIAQLAEWPKGRFTTFFKGHIWSAGFLDQPFTVRWSGPAPYHKVWPILNVEVLMEDDNSPITAIHGYGEQLVVFKRDSIWIMVDTGLNEFGLQTYAPQRIVAGVGCISHRSVKQIRGNLIFLGEDGIFSFDGTPNIKKISDPVQNTVDKIVKANPTFSTAGHWKKNSLYLLSASTGDIAHDTIVVFDYKNGTWWIWNNIDAQFWLEDEEGSDSELFGFVNSYGQVFNFIDAANDYGPTISSYALTQRFTLEDNTKFRVRQVEVTSDNKSRSVTCEVLANDEDSGSSTTLDFTDSNEKDWDDTITNGTDSWVPKRRRARRAAYRKDCDWAQVKVSHSTKNQPFKCSSIDLSVAPLGRR